MSRLYAKINSDARKSQATARGNETISGRVLYGNKNEPKIALSYTVFYPKGANDPTVKIDMVKGFKVNQLFD